MKVLVLGSGGREHALVWALSASPLASAVFVAPGNAGMRHDATVVALDIFDFPAVIAFCREQEIDFVIVGPEQPLIAGIVDAVSAAGIKIFGPTREAARLEGSKAFTKELCRRHNIPTAAYKTFDSETAAVAYIREQGAPIVVKADGLAAGKGAVVCTAVDDAVAAARNMLAGQFGDAGKQLVIEECMQGEEVSFFALVSGRTILPLLGAQDHKRVGEGDTGPNTGGMGAYSPAPILDDVLSGRVMDDIIRPTVTAMADEGMPFTGILYAGLMITDTGPKLIEYNVRFGDPECQVLMARLKSDLLPALIAATDGVLEQFDLRWYDDAAMTVVMATEGYPGDYAKGSEIGGLAAASAIPGVTVFHAATRDAGDGRILADGGRVLAVTGTGPTIAAARDSAYRGVAAVEWPEGIYRRDIGWRALGRSGELDK